MLFSETVAVYCENRTEHINILCGQKAEFYYVKLGVTYSNHYSLKELNISLDMSFDNMYDWKVI
jgi:hypothetical protein